MTKAQKFSIEATQESDFPKWYKETITKSEVLDYHDINGCYVLRPNGYFIWKVVKEYFDKKIEAMGVQEAMFPMLLTKGALEKEKDHLENFAPEVAWITECGGKALESPVAIRPTSEAIIYPYFSKWIQSYRDLPVKVNQWCNILRWEMTQPMPFVRGREFLWQEGHTAHFEREDADREVREILEHYADVYESVLAVPVVRGMKSKKETFAGADYTTTVEAFIPATGRGIQAATSHSLGINFAKMFDVAVEDPSDPGKKRYAFQNSWGLSTRSIGVCILVHSDNRGLVLPPKVAPIQAVIVPCGVTKSMADEDKAKLARAAEGIAREARELGVRVHLDSSEHLSPGHKFNHWEVRGVPLRIELGPKDLSEDSAAMVWRCTGDKKKAQLKGIGESIRSELEAIQSTMYERAKAARDSKVTVATHMEQVEQFLREKLLVKFAWCSKEECENEIKEKTTERDDDGSILAAGAKSLCIPFDQSISPEANLPSCINCGRTAECIGLFGRSY